MSAAPAGGHGRPAPQPVGPRGLCPDCRHVRVVRSPKGSSFLLCELAAQDAKLPRYPPQPRFACPAFER